MNENANVCRNCHREVDPSGLDPHGWCSACRRWVVRRANLWGRGAALLVALAAMGWLVSGHLPAGRFLVAWMVLIVALYFVVLKIVRRVAFEVIRSRAESRERR